MCRWRCLSIFLLDWTLAQWYLRLKSVNFGDISSKTIHAVGFFPHSGFEGTFILMSMHFELHRAPRVYSLFRSSPLQKTSVWFMEVRVCLENSFTQVIIDDFGLYHSSKNRSFILWRRKWEKGRGTVLVFDPKIGPLDNIYVNFQNSWMLSGTLDRGMHSRSQPSALSKSAYSCLLWWNSYGDQIRSIHR